MSWTPRVPNKTELVVVVLLLLLLLLLLQAPSCPALGYPTEPLNETINFFSSARMDIALLMPLALKLQLNSSVKLTIDHDSVIKDLMFRLQSRRAMFQGMFYRATPNQGFILSDVSKFRIEDGRLVLFYYAGFLGTSDMPVLQERLQYRCDVITRVTHTALRPTCYQYSKLTSTFVTNLSLLSKFRILAPSLTYFPSMAQRFTEFQQGGKGFVTADFSPEHDTFQLLCKVLLPCRAELCNISRIIMKPELKALPAWKITDTLLTADLTWDQLPYSAAELNTSNIFPNDADYASKFIVYRSWCMKGAVCSSRSSFWLLLASLACMSVLLSNGMVSIK